MMAVIRRSTVVLAATALLVTLAPAVQAAAEPEARTPGMRTGVTWSVLEHRDGYVRVGADRRTDQERGDSSVDNRLSALCFNAGKQTQPAWLKTSRRTGWSGGSVKSTPPISGDVLRSRADADAACAVAFGTGWRMADIQDGTGAGSWWATGELVEGARYWVANPAAAANPWDSAGATAGTEMVVEDDTYLLQARLRDVMYPMLRLTANINFRTLVRNAAARRFDGDSNAMLSSIIYDGETTGVIDPDNFYWQEFKYQASLFGNINGQAYYPQLFIPNQEDGLTQPRSPTMSIFETNLSLTSLPGYYLEPLSGRIMQRTNPVDEIYVETNEVWVLNVHEVISGAVHALSGPPAPAGRQAASEGVSSTADGIGTMVTCNPTGLRNNNGMEYLQRFKVPNPRDLEHWTAGKLEMRVAVVATGGLTLINAYFGKIKRKTIKNWVYQNLYLATWNRTTLGEVMAYKWLEIDGGPKLEVSLGFSVQILKALKAEAGVKAIIEKKFDDAGEKAVFFTESTYIDYSTGVLQFTTCSAGGDGGTGNDNFALQATTAASSTFSGYSPARVNDGSRNTTVGGPYSWTNAGYNGYWPPQWVQLDFGTNRTFSRVVIYTSEGYPIADFDIQVWNGSAWVTPAGGQVRGNTALVRTLTFAPQTSRLVRVLGLAGPAVQAGWVRVNEFEVYAQ